MREIRQSGSEGGAVQFNALSLPLSMPTVNQKYAFHKRYMGKFGIPKLE